MNRVARKAILSAVLAVALLLAAVIWQPWQLSAGTKGLGQSGPDLGASGPALGESDLSLGSSSEDALLATYLVEEDWALVGSFGALSDALKAKEPYIRLTADIDMAGQLDLTYKVVIDGRKADGSGYHTLNETESKNTFRVNEPGQEITLQNLHIYGYDFYGIVTSLGADSKSAGTTLLLDHVHYQGPQVVYLRYDSTVIIRDSLIELQKNGSGNDAEEVGEAAQFIIGGKTEIRKHSHEASIFWIYNHGASSSRNGLLKFEQDAEVLIYNPRTYLTFRETGENGVKQYDIVVEDGAKVDIRTNLGWCHDSGRYVDNFIVGKNAQVTMSRTGTNASQYLFINRSLQVGEGSVFVMEDVRPIIALYSRDVEILFDNPALVRIDYSITGMDASYTPRQVTMTGKTFNTWQSSPVTGPPDYQLNAPRGQPVTITYSGGVAKAGYLDEDGQQVSLQADHLLPQGHHTVSKQTRFVMGDYDLMVNRMTVYSTKITGARSPDASLSAAYYTVANPDRRTVIAAVNAPEHNAGALSVFVVDTGIAPDEQGYGPFHPEEEILFHLVRALPHQEEMLQSPSYLHATEARALDDRGSLQLKSVPEVLQFGPRDLPGKLSYFPLTDSAQVVVLDDRIEPAVATWNLTAVSTPLVSGGVSLGYAIGVLENDQFTSLEREVRLWSGKRLDDATEQSKTWEAGGGGLVVQVDPYRAQVGIYEAEIVWTLSVGV